MVLDNVCGFEILMLKTIRATMFFLIFSNFFCQPKRKSNVRWVISLLFFEKCPEHPWMAQAGFWLSALWLIAAEGQRLPARGCGSEWPQQVPGHEMSLLPASPSVSK